MTAKIKQKKKTRTYEFPEGLTGTLAALAAIVFCFRRIPLTNLIGDAGNAYYSVAEDWFLLLLTICAAGMTLAVSSVISLRIERGRMGGAGRTVTSSMSAGLLIALILCAAGLAGASLLTKTINRIPLAALPLRLCLPALIPVTALCILTGGLDGYGNIHSTGFARIFFYVILTAAGCFIARPAFTYGDKVGALMQNDQYGPAYGAMGAAAAFAAASLAALLAAFFSWQRQRSYRKSLVIQDGQREEKEEKIYRTVLIRRLPWMITASLVMLAMIGQSVLYFRVTEALGQQNRFLHWGIFTGKSRVILLPPIFAAAAFAMRQFPGVRLSFESRNMKRIRERCMVALRCIALFTVPCAVYFAILSRPLTELFFTGGDMTTAAALIRNGSICVVIFSIDIMLGIILIGADLLKSVAVGLSCAVILHLAALYAMLEFLHLGIDGVLYANIILSVLILLFFFISIQRHTRLRLNWLRIFLAPGIGSALIAAVCAVLQSFMADKAAPGILIAVSFPVCLILYFVVETVLHGLTNRELKEFPGGERISALARLLRLM